MGSCLNCFHLKCDPKHFENNFLRIPSVHSPLENSTELPKIERGLSRILSIV